MVEEVSAIKMMTNDGNLLTSAELSEPISGGLTILPSVAVPVLVANSGDHASHKFVEYFIGQIRNRNTRQAYGRAIQQFLDWCEQLGAQRLEDINYMVVSAYIEQHPAAPQTVKQHLAAIRQLFEWLKQQHVLRDNPAENVKGPKHRVKVGKTPVLETPEMRQLFDSFDTTQIVGLRDRALIGIMTYTFARVSAVVMMDIKDVLLRSGQHRVRLIEKNSKFMEVPLHHTGIEYLSAYIEAAKQQEGLNWEKETPLFRSIKRTGGRNRPLTENRLTRQKAWEMVKRRAAEAGVSTDICCHTFRGTGITNYLENGGSRDTAQELAGHEDVRTTALYDRRASKVSLDEIERMRF